MKLYQIIILLTLVLCLSCNGGKVEETNTSLNHELENIKGVAFLKGSSLPTKYTPKGNFIHVRPPDSGIWQYMILKKSNRKIEYKLFFPDDDDKRTLLYDNLALGEYHIEYISELRDTIKEKLVLRHNIELKFPEKLNEVYDEVNIQDLEIENLTQKDTLELLYQEYGCFGGSETLIEFIFNSEDEIILRKMDMSLDSSGKLENKWIYLESDNLKYDLNNFVQKAKNLKTSNLDLCTSSMFYIFRTKNTKLISIIEDESCQLMNEINKIIYPK
ncbi:hypothetical protein [Winogradskyella psychrotolerans]|uniref:hypothetical protein n=1 Tax=Winogradskyella psychrotolerans TaxID=1344585 RepID=UPI001C066055|nr:hypothetical protein [Winogradskyella psychrotolerans]MBU2929034.1 hypothetical protein [Winogradskyella psychrotolerans]